MDTKLLLAWLDRSVHDIAGSVATAAGAIAVMDPALVTQTLGPKGAAWVLLIGGAVQLAKSQQERMRAAAPPTVSPPEIKP